MASDNSGPSSEGKSLAAEFIKAAKQAPAIYFAPLLGAVNGVLRQWQKCHAAALPVAS